jgi:hypothetical protein
VQNKSLIIEKQTKLQLLLDMVLQILILKHRLIISLVILDKYQISMLYIHLICTIQKERICTAVVKLN